MSAALAGRAAAQVATSAAPASERFPIWPGRPPGEPGKAIADVVIQRSATPGDTAWTSVGTPMLTIARPAKSNGAAVLLIPGGGYKRIATRREPGDISRQIAARGFTVFELLYRLPHDGWAAGPDAPLQDAQRAMRIIRAGAGKRWPIDPAKVAAIGFSAGGHLAARLATRSALKTYDPVDAIDGQPARPLVAGLFFPVITMLNESVHSPSRTELLGKAVADPVAQRRWSAQLDLPADTPPTFVATNADDGSVPPANALLIHGALIAAKVPTELHMFERGGHGLPAPRRDGTPVPWLDLFLGFAGDHGMPDRQA
ncbi:alpha/beta hydrolase [Sphingomonas sp. RS2018]